MRINPDSTTYLLNVLSSAQEEEQVAMRQMSTGRRVQVASDDPAASAAVSVNLQEQSRQDQYLQSISSVREMLSASDSALSGVVEALTRAVTVGVQGATGTLSGDERTSLANEVDGIRDQVLSLANASFQGVFLFSGTKLTTKPFSADENSASVVAYSGNQLVNSVYVGDGHLVPTAVAGDSLFMDPAANVFGSLQGLVNALKKNDADGVATATGQVRDALSHVSGLRVTYGSGLSLLDSDEQFLQSAKLQAQARETELVGVDPAEAITRMQQAQYARDATLAAVARTQQKTLLDYLP
ncbi:MAG: flagellar hook-associated protein FlgL [Terriglobia bacterium]|nr:flagellar hook-associated protein FlgL [Terriglobia bacterium]